MAKSLTQSSLKASRKQHADASHLSRKDGIYYYRRLLPPHLGTDVALSLGTRNYREAEHLAAALDLSFRHAVQTAKSTADLRSVLRKYIEDALAEDMRMRFAIPVGYAVYGLGTEPPPGRDIVELDRATIAVALDDARRALAARDFPSVEDTVRHLMKDHGLPEGARSQLAYGVLEADVKIFEEQQRRTLGKSPLVLLDDPRAIAAPPSPSTAAGPLFSKALPTYIDLAVKDKGWRGQSKAQHEATFTMFQQVCGDLPVTAYTRSHLSDFYNVLRGLPALYSKDKRWRDLPLREVVEKVKEDPAPRPTMKTVKRHFSALGGFFTYAKRHGMIQGENPAYGFEFPPHQMYRSLPLFSCLRDDGGTSALFDRYAS